MFLDDELKTILSENGFGPSTSVKLLKACISRIPDPEKVGSKSFLDTLKQIDFSWRLFCKSNPRLNPNGFRDWVSRDGLEPSIKNYLNW